jgi:hypothetical protein
MLFYSCFTTYRKIEFIVVCTFLILSKEKNYIQMKFINRACFFSVLLPNFSEDFFAQIHFILCEMPLTMGFFNEFPKTSQNWIPDCSCAVFSIIVIKLLSDNNILVVFQFMHRHKEEMHTARISLVSVILVLVTNLLDRQLYLKARPFC